MMGQQSRTESLFYYFRLEDQIPKDHLLRVIDEQIDFSFVRERVKSLYSATGRPSIDPEVVLRLLLVGYLYGITSARRGYRGQRRVSRGHAYCSTPAQCAGCPQKQRCTSGSYRWLFIHGEESARQAARALAGTPAYERSRRARYKVEGLFAELKQRRRLGRVRLRRLWNVSEQFLLAATAQNIKRLVRFLARRPPRLEPGISHLS